MTSSTPSHAWEQVEEIRERLNTADPYRWIVTDIRHDRTPVYEQMGDPVADLRTLLDVLDAARAADASQIEELRQQCDRVRGELLTARCELSDLSEKFEALDESASGMVDSLELFKARQAELLAITEPWQGVHHLDPHQCLFGRFHPVEEVARAREAERVQHQAQVAALSAQVEQLQQQVGQCECDGPDKCEQHDVLKRLRIGPTAVDAARAADTSRLALLRKEVAGWENDHKKTVEHYEARVTALSAQVEQLTQENKTLTDAIAGAQKLLDEQHAKIRQLRQQGAEKEKA